MDTQGPADPLISNTTTTGTVTGDIGSGGGGGQTKFPDRDRHHRLQVPTLALPVGATVADMVLLFLSFFISLYATLLGKSLYDSPTLYIQQDLSGPSTTVSSYAYQERIDGVPVVLEVTNAPPSKAVVPLEVRREADISYMLPFHFIPESEHHYHN
jgi:hypothetical protein